MGGAFSLRLSGIERVCGSPKQRPNQSIEPTRVGRPPLAAQLQRSIAMRSPTSAGMTAAGHAPLSDMGCYVVAGNADAYEKMVALEEATPTTT